MKPLAIYCCLVIVLPSLASAQLVLVDEQNIDGKSNRLPPNRRIVDINSSLHLTIDREKLMQQIMITRPATLAALGDELISRMNAVTELLQARKRTDSLFRKTMAEYAAKSTGLFKGYNQFVQDVNAATLPVLNLLENYPEIKQRYTIARNLADDGGSPLVDANLTFAAAEEVVSGWENQLEQQLREKGAYVQVGAWIVRSSGETPLHLEGFDNYADGQRYIIDRFVIGLTDEQKRQLQVATDAAKEINRTLEQDKPTVTPILNGLKKTLISQFKEADSYKAIDSLRTLVASLAVKYRTNPAFLSLLDPIKRDIANYQSAVEQIVKTYKNRDSTLTPDGRLIQSNDDLVKLTTTTQAFLSGLTNDRIPPLELAVKKSTGEPLKDVRKIYDSAFRLQTAITADLNQVKQTIATVLQTFGIKTFDATVLHFTDKVSRLALDQLPTETDVRIVNSGAREKGDLIVIRIGAGFGEGAVRYLETQQFLLYKVLPHVETTIGVILANPVSSQSTTGKSKFQAAPSYSVLARGLFDRRWRKRSATYHNLMDIGVGLNVSAPDFDRDNIPELGVGVALSLFRDYVQGGVGYNVFLDKQYWFWGLRLPLPTFNLVGSPKTP